MKCIAVVPHLLVHRGNLCWSRKKVNEENDKAKKAAPVFLFCFFMRCDMRGSPDVGGGGGGLSVA